MPDQNPTPEQIEAAMQEARAAMEASGIPGFLLFQPSPDAVELTNNAGQALMALQQHTQQASHIQAKQLLEQFLNPILQMLVQMSVQYQQDMVQHTANMTSFFAEQLRNEQPQLELAVDPELSELIVTVGSNSKDLLENSAEIVDRAVELLAAEEPDTDAVEEFKSDVEEHKNDVTETIKGLNIMIEEVEVSTYVEDESTEEPAPSTVRLAVERPPADEYEETSLL